MRLPLTFPSTVIGDMFNIVNGTTMGSDHFSQLVLEKKVSVKISMNCSSFTSRCDLLGIKGIQRVCLARTQSVDLLCLDSRTDGQETRHLRLFNVSVIQGFSLLRCGFETYWKGKLNCSH